MTKETIQAVKGEVKRLNMFYLMTFRLPFELTKMQKDILIGGMNDTLKDFFPRTLLKEIKQCKIKQTA
jgi:hypothetical protein